MSEYTLADVAKHTTKADCWVVVNGEVLDVTSFLSEHPGGELAILTFAGKDATEEFNMIHPPDVIPKYAPKAVIGKVGDKPAEPAAAPAAASAPPSGDKGGVLANHHAWGHHDADGRNWRFEVMEDNPGVFLINVKAYMFAAIHMWISILYEVCATIFTAKNFKISNERLGLTRSAILLIFFIVIHALGNLHVFMGPDDFNGYGYFYVRLYWTGFGLPANIVEEYVLLGIMLHVFVGLKRTWDMKLAMGVRSGALNLAISGVTLLTFMTIHLFQFRFGETEDYYLAPPPYLVNFSWGLFKLKLFWDTSVDLTTEEGRAQMVPVRDIYKLEYDVFQRSEYIFGLELPNVWAYFYIFAVVVFMMHGFWGFKKVTPALGVPKGHHFRAETLGILIIIAVGLIYISFPVYCLLTEPFAGEEPQPAK